jgi:FixJ family two-component response regulator
LSSRVISRPEVARSKQSTIISSRTGDSQPDEWAPPVIAIVDDDVHVLRSLERLFRSAGCRTQTFTSAEEFLRSTDREVLSCLVLDVGLQGMNGLDLQNHLVSKGVHIPIVFLTAVDFEEVRSFALSAGAVAFLAKPVDEKELLVAVHTAIGE